MKRPLNDLSDTEVLSPFWDGFRDALPVQLGNFPFGIIVGVTAVELGFTAIETTLLSVTTFAGASQLAAVFLIAEQSPIAVVLLTVILINIRFLMYSASLAPVFQSYSRVRKAVYSFFITDPVFALSIPRLRDPQDDQAQWYYVGTGASIWLFFVLGTAIGAGLGLEVPEAFPVALVLPLVLIALLFPMIKDRPTVATAVVAGSVATAAAPLNYNLGLLVGVFCGLLAGVTLKR